MKFCQPHWGSLRAAIDARGLAPLVAKSGQAAHANLVAELDGSADASNYDPLMSAHWMISGRALELGGLYLLNGEYCPLCEVEEHTKPGAAQEWIEGCTDSVLAHCRKLGLVPEAS